MVLGFPEAGVALNPLALARGDVNRKIPFVLFVWVWAVELHITLWGLERVAFLVWVVSLLWFVCGESGRSTQSTLMLCCGVRV